MAEAYEEPLLLLNNNNEKIDYEIVDALNGFEVSAMKKKVHKENFALIVTMTVVFNDL